MKCTDCKSCRWADVADKPRMIVRGNATMYQAVGSVNCTCAHIKEMTISDDGLICSSYEEKDNE